MSKQSKGILITIMAGIAWGISGVSGQYLLSQGIAVELLTSLRLIISGLFLIGIAYITAKPQLQAIVRQKRALLDVTLFAIGGLVLNQMAYLQAIHYTNAGTATVLQYLCPVLVLCYTCLRLRQVPTKLECLAVLLAIIGTYLLATHGQLDRLAITPIGLAWGIFSAFTYAYYIIFPAQLIREYGSVVVIGLGMLIGGIVVLLTLQTWTYSLPLNHNYLLALVGLIGVGTIFAYTAFIKGVSMIGPVKGSLLASIEPIASVFFAVWLLQEQFFMVDFLGIFLILIAVVSISKKKVG